VSQCRSLEELASASTTVQAPVALQFVVSKGFGGVWHWRKRPSWLWMVRYARDSTRFHNRCIFEYILLYTLRMCVCRQCSLGVHPRECQICDNRMLARLRHDANVYAGLFRCLWNAYKLFVIPTCHRPRATSRQQGRFRHKD
jgi:hypothetical protein